MHSELLERLAVVETSTRKQKAELQKNIETLEVDLVTATKSLERVSKENDDLRTEADIAILQITELQKLKRTQNTARLQG